MELTWDNSFLLLLCFSTWLGILTFFAPGSNNRLSKYSLPKNHTGAAKKGHALADLFFPNLLFRFCILPLAQALPEGFSGFPANLAGTEESLAIINKAKQNNTNK